MNKKNIRRIEELDFKYQDEVLIIKNFEINFHLKVIYQNTIGFVFEKIVFKLSKNDNILNKWNIDEPDYIFSINIIKNDNLLIIKNVKKIIFQNCKILNKISIDNISNIVFEKCYVNIALNKFLPYISENAKLSVKFDECKILSFIIKNYNKDINFIIVGGSIENLIISTSTIKSKFYINKQYDNNSKQTIIKNIDFTNVVFEKNFKLHHCIVDNFLIADVDFEKNADFFLSAFKNGCDDSICFKAINFKKLVLFGNTVFHKKLIFKYVTFEGYTHFRESKLLKGIDLDYSNIQKEINFYGIDIQDYSSMTQETFRIMKHHLQEIGNHIEANKYHALELNQNRKNIWNSDNISFDLFQRGIVSFIHYITSNHSQSWLVTLFWIFVVSVVVSFSIDNTYSIKYISILVDIDKNEYTNLFLFHKISLGYLYYQLLVTIRKDTKK